MGYDRSGLSRLHALHLDALLDGPPHRADPAELLEDPNAPCREVDLALEHSVARAGGVGVVQVVPGLTEGRDRQPPDVAGLVARLERTLAHCVADGVDG